MKKFPIFALCAAAAIAGLVLQAVPAIAQSRLRICADEWNAMKANSTVGDKKWSDFRKECLARTAAAPSDAAPASTPAATPAPKAAARAAKSTPAAAPGPPGAAGAAGTISDAVFPTEVSSKYSDERPALARMHSCRDQYQKNKANHANGGLTWLQKGGGYYSECNKRLKEG